MCSLHTCFISIVRLSALRQHKTYTSKYIISATFVLPASAPATPHRAIFASGGDHSTEHAHWGYYMIAAVTLQVLSGWLRVKGLGGRNANYSLFHRVGRERGARCIKDDALIVLFTCGLSVWFSEMFGIRYSFLCRGGGGGMSRGLLLSGTLLLHFHCGRGGAFAVLVFDCRYVMDLFYHHPQLSVVCSRKESVQSCNIQTQLPSARPRW